ncbi:uncharacterized protein LOC116805916 [Drosophila grimshawi]|uniref:uncharacterized protein LOC116805916 n=1 Tax=Drosophila grimshawi TaxID=7222 RepID=UPI000C870DEE|nr:uncharacterized protein LOC116805916 [Drosophila grimshawi]
MEIISGANLYLRQLGERRPNISGLNSNIFIEGGLQRNSLVEISGRRNSGKSLLLMQLVAHCLPHCDVILIDLNQKIDMQLLGGIVKRVVLTENPNATADKLQEIFAKCLDSLEIVNCFSSRQARMALKTLDHHLLLDNERISLVAVDGLCEFYWFDLAPNTRMRKYRYYVSWLERINRISKRFHVCCMWTVDNSYLKNRYAPFRGITIDHKLQLNLYKKGRRTLNNQNIIINEQGIQFE